MQQIVSGYYFDSLLFQRTIISADYYFSNLLFLQPIIPLTKYFRELRMNQAPRRKQRGVFFKNIFSGKERHSTEI